MHISIEYVDNVENAYVVLHDYSLCKKTCRIDDIILYKMYLDLNAFDFSIITLCNVSHGTQ